MIPWLETDTPFPPVSSALTEQDGAAGLLAAGGDLSPARLLDAYRHGIFPWFSDQQPILWWSTDPRMVLKTADLKISHSLRKKLRKVEQDMRSSGPTQVCFDTNFSAVIRACAGPRREGAGTWISDDIVEGYTALHQMGFAHSAEFRINGELMAGAYGVSIGTMFFGESMFARVSDGSKIALAFLVHFLRQHGVEMIDCQQETEHLASLGAMPISRASFLEHLETATRAPQIQHWQPLAQYGF